ncbi:uncharacterized protein LOC106652617 isoform X1 [Trichogramma pretiosum]|uniref:uncharacterized protein LOC106652617 isoform X1 n=1 Tax=Trichogramma pretiosum TaxID=7493 RepID=UPI0006C96962|nr:uncharacterized protein LOC106652617 isoform X1 [Trichogramma pretiosum]
MNYIVLLSAVLGCAMARPQVLQLAPLSQLETSASALAAASASSSQPQLSLLQLLQRAPLSADGRVLDTLEVRLAKAEHEAAHQRARANLVNARALGLAAPLTSSSVSAQSSASASSSRTPSPLTVNTLENDLVRAALGLERREPLRLTNESVQSQVQSQTQQQQQQQQQRVADASSLLDATRLAQRIASLTPLGVSGTSRAQIVESIARQQQQQEQAQRQTQIILTRDAQLEPRAPLRLVNTVDGLVLV